MTSSMTKVLPMICISLVVPTGLVVGCANQSDLPASPTPINPVLLTCPQVTIDVYSVNGTMPPQGAWDRALERFGRCLSGQVIVNEPEHITVSVDEKGFPAEAAIRIDQPGEVHILVIFMPKARKVNRGLCQRHSNTRHVIRYNADKIENALGGILPRDTIWEIVLLHELGHAIGVPGDPSHTHRGSHCTNPSCVMYSSIDICSALSVLVHGWPRDFCKACMSDMARAKIMP